MLFRFILLFFVLAFNDIACTSKSKIKMVQYQLPGLSVSIPQALYQLLRSLKNENIKKLGLCENRIILHGPPGNGKTTIAKAIAEHLEGNLFEERASSVVTSMQGSGSSNIKELFQKAKEAQQNSESGRMSIIFIDEIDAIATINHPLHKDHESATQELWQELDSIKNNPNIIVVVATNKFKQLHPTFVKRFNTKNVIKIPNPDDIMRREVINFFLNKLDIKDFNKTEIDRTVKGTNGLSIRDIEQLFTGEKIRAILDHQGKINKIEFFNAINTYKKNKNKYEYILNKIKSITLDDTYKICSIINAFYTILSMRKVPQSTVLEDLKQKLKQ